MTLFQTTTPSTNCVTNADGSVTITMSQTNSFGIDVSAATIYAVVLFLAILTAYFLISKRRSNPN